jgi:hypothetical protein
MVAWFVVADPGLAGFVRERRGTGFAVYFMAVHLAMNVVLVAGMIVGGLGLLRRTGRLSVRPLR